MVIDSKGGYQSKYGTEYPAEFHQWEKQIGAHLLGQPGKLQEGHWTEVVVEDECFGSSSDGVPGSISSSGK